MRKIPEGVTEVEAVMVNDVLATAHYAVHNGGVKAGDTVIIYGTGPIGLMAALLSKRAGAQQVIAINRSKARLEAALDHHVADAVIYAQDQDPVQAVAELTHHMGANVVIETIGTEDSINSAIQMARMQGTISSVSVLQHPISVNWARLLGKNLTLKTGMQNFEGCDEMLQEIAFGTLDVKWLATHQAPLNDVLYGYEVFSSKADGCIKWLITPYDHSRTSDFSFRLEDCRIKW